MKTSTYQDLIEDKIAAWQADVEKITARIEKAGAGGSEKANQALQQFMSDLQSAAQELRALSSQENAGNTVVIKDKMLKVFDAIDKDLKNFEQKAPFML